MRARLPRSPWVVLSIVLTLSLASGPTLAAVVFDAENARNADKVDGRHAVGAGATRADRAGRLVATDSEGRLPNNIILKAPDAAELDGFNSTDFQLRISGTCAEGSMVTAVNPDGTVACATPQAAGGDATTLDGQDSTAFQQRVDGTCPAGSMVTAVNADGSLTCATDSADGGNATTFDGLDSPDFQRRVSGTCPANNKLLAVNADGTVSCAPDAVDGGNASTLGGLSSTAFQLRGARTILVRTGGTATANGTALRNALNGTSIPVSGDTAPSATNPWVVQLEPGRYDIGVSPLSMRNHVHIVGAGESSWITCACDNFEPTVRPASDTHLRSVTVETTGGPAGVALAIHVQSGRTNVVIADVHARASGGTGATRAIQNDTTGLVLDDVDATATGTAPQVEGIGFGNGSTDIRGGTIRATGADPYALYSFGGTGVHQLRGVKVVATGTDAAVGTALGAYVSSGRIDITDGVVEASGADANHAVYVSGNLNVDRSTLTAVGNGSAVNLAGGNIRIGGSRLDGATTTGGTGTIMCALTYRTPGYTETNTACG